MYKKNRLFHVFFASLLLLAACAKAPPPADLVLTGGTVYTLDDSGQTAEAVAVRDGRIVVVGEAADVQELIGENTRVIELDGAFVYPGFTDSHMHLRGVGERELTLNLEGTESLAALQARVAEEVAKREPGEWIIGRGWIETHWNPPVFPTRADLDAIAPENPVALTRVDGHALVVNSAALELAGIDAATRAPFGGAIPKDDNGEPAGMLIDNAMGLLGGIMPDSTISMDRALVVGAERSARTGWTGVQVAGITWQEAMRLRELVETGKIPVRIYAAIEGPSENAQQLLEHGPVIDASSGRFTLRGIKVSVDGALGSRGAALLEPYSDADTTGLLTWRREDLMPLYVEALKKGVQIETHAIGDRANRFILDLYSAAFEHVPEAERKISDPRWRIEHAQILSEEDIPRFAKLGVIPSMQASHAIGDLHFAERRLGEERLEGAYAWRSLRDTGVIIPGGSDAPVEQGDPRIEFYAAVARSDLDGFQGENWHPEQALTRIEALKMLTLWPAYAAFEEDMRGSIVPGKYADFTVLEGDLLNLPKNAIPQTGIIMTIVGGDIVYDAR